MLLIKVMKVVRFLELVHARTIKSYMPAITAVLLRISIYFTTSIVE